MLIGFGFSKNPKNSRHSKYLTYIIGSFRNGKLHGIIQMFGQMTVDPKGHCSESIMNGLSFVGWFENGKLTGKDGEIPKYNEYAVKSTNNF